MNIAGLHTNHDSGIAVVRDGRLALLLETQKDNNWRYSAMKHAALPRVQTAMPDDMDIVAHAGWHDRPGGYFGAAASGVHAQPLEGSGGIQWVTTSHERAHALCAYAMSPYPQGQPCYLLIWEGEIGTFYSIDEDCTIVPLCTPLREPGHRYTLAYELAHTDCDDDSRGYTYAAAGKLMALAGVADEARVAVVEPVIEQILDGEGLRKRAFRSSPYWNTGHTAPAFRSFAHALSDRMFERFFDAISQRVSDRRPLLIAGGCGLNCGWNTRWRDSGLFADVFIPPCPDDSGIPIGAAVDAQRLFTGKAKLSWSVYSGEPFACDAGVPASFREDELDCRRLAQMLLNGAVIAWVEGRYEIGPRALGHRSLLASPFNRSMTDRLNWIKSREDYRPIAPVCREEDVSKHFAWNGPSPYMLHFQRVTDPRLKAVTHEDGTARIQTITGDSNPQLYRLLTAFADLTGVGVLCNTSLNFPGRGFVNRMSDLTRFVVERRLEAFVVDQRMYVNPSVQVSPVAAGY
jgi:predicted NodU family carbamoyl transferase